MEAIFSAWGRILGGYQPALSIEITRECPLRCPGPWLTDWPRWSLACAAAEAALEVANASNPSPARIRAEPGSHGLGIRKAPARWCST